MNLFFYLQAFILNYSFIVIQAIIFFVLCFIKTQHFVKRKPVKTEKNTGNFAFRFKQVLVYYYSFVLSCIMHVLLCSHIHIHNTCFKMW